MTSTAIALRHVPFEDLGILEPLLTERDYKVCYADVGTGPLNLDVLREAELLVVLGGPIGAGDLDQYPFLRTELAAIEYRLQNDLPTLGICLGAQLIAVASGAKVRAAKSVEIGYSPLNLADDPRDEILLPLGDTPVLHWHGDEFLTPELGVRLAFTSTTRDQAFSIGVNTLALQFHLEAEHNSIEQWLIGHAHEISTNEIDPRSIRAAAAEFGAELEAKARVIFAAWLDRLNDGPAK